MNTRRNRQHNTVLLETVLATVVFAIVVFAVFDFSRMYYFHSRLQHAVSQSTRFATAGNTVEDPVHPGERMSEEESIVYMIQALSGIEGLSDDDVTVLSTASDGTRSAGVGRPGDVVTVRADWRVPIIAPFLYALFPGGHYEFSAVTDFRNLELPANGGPHRS